MSLFFALVACAPAAPPPPPEAPAPPQFQLAQPNVRMDADPPPPFTYWAPEGAVITNHEHVEGIWFADLDGRRVATYFGDACRASDMQQWVGQPLSALQQPSSGANWRITCTTCDINADLQRDRVNVLFNETTQIVEAIACY